MELIKKKIIINTLKAEGLCYTANKHHISKKILYCFDLAFYPIIFYNWLCRFVAVTLIAKSLLFLGHEHIPEMTQTLHILFRDSGELGLTTVKWSQQARARTLWTDELLFVAIPIAKRQIFLRYLLLSTVMKRTKKMMKNSWQTKAGDHLGTSGLDHLPTRFRSLVYLPTPWPHQHWST